MLLSESTNTVEALDWQEFQSLFKWDQGEHITLIGPTGCGKTTLTKALIPMREWNIFLGSKKKDDTQDQLSSMGFEYAGSPAGIHPDISKNWIVKPPFPDKYSAEQLKRFHAMVFRETLMRAYRDGSWTVYIDEARYITDILGLRDEVVLLLLQGRSQGNSIVLGTQRPRNIPLEAYDQPTHLFFWKDTDLQNVKRAAELAGVNRSRVARAVGALDKHEFLYANTRTGVLAISQVDLGEVI